MENYCSHTKLPIIDYELPKSKSKELEDIINNLKLNDLDSEDKFATTLNRIKTRILLNPVSFEEPQIKDHHQTEKDYPTGYNNMWGGKKKVFIITTEIKFNGAADLFKYAPNGYSFGSKDHPYIYQPSGNSIFLNTEHPNIDDKDGVYNEVQQKMNLTYNFIKNNNLYVENWNALIEPQIENKLRSHKEKLEALYKR